MHRDDWTGKKTKKNPAAYAWFVFDRDHRGPIIIDRISHDETPGNGHAGSKKLSPTPKRKIANGEQKAEAGS